MGINSYKFSQLFQWLQSICTKQMHEFIFYSFFLSAISKFLIGKMTLKNIFENRFSKPKTGFRFSNRKPDFRFSINIPRLLPLSYLVYFTLAYVVIGFMLLIDCAHVCQFSQLQWLTKYRKHGWML